MIPKKIILGLIVATTLAYSNASTACNKQTFDQSSFVCVCNEETCDTVDPIKAIAHGSYIVYTSDNKENRFATQTGAVSSIVKPFRKNIKFLSTNSTTVTINKSVKQQEILGFGGAFTDATGINIAKLSGDMQYKLMEAYFGSEGIEYNLGRVPMGGTDFSTKGYSYDDTEQPDPELVHFALQPEDHDYKIPFIKQAMQMNKNLDLFTSVWTAPKWIKTNGKYNGGAIIDKYYQVWADYFIKFFENYEKEGINFWAVTTGNEPSLALVESNINSVRWLGENMRKWIRDNLGPTIRGSKYKDLKIFTLDDQRFFLPWYPEQVIKNDTDKYVDGIAVHWYWDFLVPASLLTITHEMFPNKLFLATEACRGDKAWEEAVTLGDWTRAEDYAHGIIEDLNHFVQGFVDWNMALDPTGGPTYINNQVDSPIIVDAVKNQFYKQPMYYALGHFSKFIPRGSRKIDQLISTDNIEAAAFLREDQGVVVVVMNKQDTAEHVVINDPTGSHFELHLTPRSINTIMYW